MIVIILFVCVFQFGGLLWSFNMASQHPCAKHPYPCGHCTMIDSAGRFCRFRISIDKYSLRTSKDYIVWKATAMQDVPDVFKTGTFKVLQEVRVGREFVELSMPNHDVVHMRSKPTSNLSWKTITRAYKLNKLNKANAGTLKNLSSHSRRPIDSGGLSPRSTCIPKERTDSDSDDYSDSPPEIVSREVIMMKPVDVLSSDNVAQFIREPEPVDSVRPAGFM